MERPTPWLEPVISARCPLSSIAICLFPRQIDSAARVLFGEFKDVSVVSSILGRLRLYPRTATTRAAVVMSRWGRVDRPCGRLIHPVTAEGLGWLRIPVRPLYSVESAVTGVAESGDDEFLGVQFVVDGANENLRMRKFVRHSVDAFP